MNTPDALRSAINGGRFPHAVILTGDADGVSHAAELLTCAAVCLSDGEKPCGACNGCHKAARGEHPDVTVLRPDGAEIKIGQIRDARAAMYIRANEAPRRVLVIEQADAMNSAAQNALLQTLEEPPAVALFILSARNDAALLPTVRSRAQTFRFAATADAPAVAAARFPASARELAEACGALGAMKPAELALSLDAARNAMKYDTRVTALLARALDMSAANVVPAAIAAWLYANLSA